MTPCKTFNACSLGIINFWLILSLGGRSILWFQTKKRCPVLHVHKELEKGRGMPTKIMLSKFSVSRSTMLCPARHKKGSLYRIIFQLVGFPKFKEIGRACSEKTILKQSTLKFSVLNHAIRTNLVNNKNL